MGKRYVRLRDAFGIVQKMDLLTGEVSAIHEQVVGECGLRGQVLELDGATLVETPEFSAMSPELEAAMRSAHRNPNSWCVDWPHIQTENVGPQQRGRMVDLLLGMMKEANCPYKVDVVGAHRRFLLYFSDGNWHTQKKYLRLSPIPNRRPPFSGKTGKLLRKYAVGIPLEQVLKPDFHHGLVGNRRPLLYCGPAWAVRILLDGQQPGFGMCRMFVDDAGQFICSDWCQRDGKDHYHEGIDLQASAYTFPSWVMTSMVPRAISEGAFRPTSVTVTKVVISEHLRECPPVPTFDEALAKYMGFAERMKLAAGGDAALALARANELWATAPVVKLVGAPVKGVDGFGQPKSWAKAEVAGLGKKPGYEVMLKNAPTAGCAKVKLVLDVERLEAQLEGKAAPAPPVADMPNKGCTGTCGVCSLVMVDGVVSKGHKCYHPSDSQCLFTQEGIPVPPDVYKHDVEEEEYETQHEAVGA